MVVLMRRSMARLIAGAVVLATVAIVPGTNAAQETRVVEITEVRVKAGTRLEIRLRSDDTAHGFRIIGTDVNVELPKRGRGVATVTFEPQAGRYTFECSQLCGAGHEFMRGVIIAE
jgi:heme/copper-type cytochrome/quinol oxidase subunit 2